MYFSRQDCFKEIYNFFNFPSFFNLKVEWNLGFILIFFYFFQVFTGILLTLFFKVGLEDCLSSKSFILKEVELGWILSYSHTVIPSFLFFCVFFHIFKSMYNYVFFYNYLWVSGFVILFFFILISFTGYGVVGGSLGFWAIIVFMGLMESVFGEFFSFLLFSDFGAISDLILYKVFCYHFLLSLGVMVFIFFHLYMVHILGSSMGVYSIFMDFFNFYISCFFKDLFLESGFLLIFTFKMLTFLSINPYTVDLLGESLYASMFIFVMINSNWLLILFTLSKYGGSFYITSGILFGFVVLLGDFILYFFKGKKFFLDFSMC